MRTRPFPSTASTTSSACPTRASLNATSGVTIEAWVKRSKTGAWQNILAKPGNGANAAQNYALWLNTTNQPCRHLRQRHGLGVSVYAPAIDTNWHHIVADLRRGDGQGVHRRRPQGLGQLEHPADRQHPAAPHRPHHRQPAHLRRHPRRGRRLPDRALGRPHRRALPAGERRRQIPPVVTLSTPPNGSSTLDTRPHFAGSRELTAADSATVTVRSLPGPPRPAPVQTLTTTRFTSGTWSVDASRLSHSGPIPRRPSRPTPRATSAERPRRSRRRRPPARRPLLAGAGDIADCTDTAATRLRT